MRVLLDECVDVRLAASLDTVDVRTVADQGWLGISNGQLLARAAAEFDVFVTGEAPRRSTSSLEAFLDTRIALVYRIWYEQFGGQRFS